MTPLNNLDLAMEKILKKKLPGGKFSNVPAARSKTMSAIRGRGNLSTEVAFRMALVRAAVGGWVLHPRDVAGKPDVFFPERFLAIFLDGCFWHGCPRCGHIPKTNRGFWKAKIERTKARDLRTRNKLRRDGISVLRFWEHDIRSNQSKCLRRVIAKLVY